MASAALADDVYNNLDTTIDATAEVMNLTVGGSQGATVLKVQPATGDGKNGCNLTGSTTLVTSVASTNIGVATVSPASITWTSCGDAATLTVTPVAAGSATVSLAQVSNTTGGTFNLAPATFTVNVDAAPASDTTAPVITPSVSGTLGDNGWYTSDVTVSWTVSDPESTVTATTGCGPTVINADTAGTTVTCSATSAGGTSSESVTIKRDATAPEVNPASVNDATWRNSDLSVVFTATDAMSGLADLADATFNLTASAESTDSSTPTTATKTVYDNAGNSTTRSVSALIDLTGPIVTPDDVGGTTWRNTPLSQLFASSDALSGLADPANDASFTLTASAESASPSSPSIVSRDVYDVAGNVTTRSLSALIDLTKPTISGSVSPPSPNAATGWYLTAPTVTFACGDALSGIASCLIDGETTASKTLGESTSAQSVSGTATDNAGNTETTSVTGLRVDLTDPTNVQFVDGPANAGEYYFGSVPAAPTCTGDDAISGISSCVVTGYSSAVGTHELTATATDNAGRTETATRSYTVLAWDLSGFYSPVRMSLSDDRSDRVWNLVKGGSTVPLKFEVFAGVELTDTAIITGFYALQIGCAVDGVGDPVDFVTTGKTTLRYDTTEGQFIQNWQTPRSPGQCFLVRMTTADGSELTAYFRLK